MSKRKTCLIFELILLPLLISAQNKISSDYAIINLVDQLDSIPVSISFQNFLEVNNKGGHLQGVQYLNYKQNDYYFLSGSSDLYSYYSVVKMGEKNSVISVNKILEKPFKHAGGFQIYNGFMAIGIEDNSERDKSKVYIYRIDNPENLSHEPLEIIERIGTPKRATAGCVGVIEMSDYLLVVVGDWGAEHLDFYHIKKKNLCEDGETFEFVYSINMEKTNKSEWINNATLPYQNINFIRGNSDNLYLACMASNNNEENVFDLFRVEIEENFAFKIRKIFTRKFSQNKYSKFNRGAGVYLSDGSKLRIFSCGTHINDGAKITIYK